MLDWLDGLGDVSRDRLGSDDVLRPAVLWYLVQLVELAVAINGHVGAALVGRGPVDYGESFGLAARAGAISEELAEELTPATGLRDVLVHQYLEVDLDIVAASVPRARDGFRRYVVEVSRFLLDAASAASDEEA